MDDEAPCRVTSGRRRDGSGRLLPSAGLRRGGIRAGSRRPASNDDPQTRRPATPRCQPTPGRRRDQADRRSVAGYGGVRDRVVDAARDGGWSPSRPPGFAAQANTGPGGRGQVNAGVAVTLAAGCRAVVLVEGTSDQAALETLARRRGRTLAAEGICVVPMGGATNIGHFLDHYGPHGLDVRLTGLCDAGEEDHFRRGLRRAGFGHLSRAGMEALGFYVCVADLEDELIRSLGVAAVERVIAAAASCPRSDCCRSSRRSATEPPPTNCTASSEPDPAARTATHACSPKRSTSPRCPDPSTASSTTCRPPNPPDAKPATTVQVVRRERRAGTSSRAVTWGVKVPARQVNGSVMKAPLHWQVELRPRESLERRSIRGAGESERSPARREGRCMHAPPGSLDGT
jgi:hypothetical protein